MGQSDTESTSSSMRGNPGSPRDVSLLFDDNREEIAAILNNAFITPEGPSDSTEMSTAAAAMETPKRTSTEIPDIPVIDLTSPDGVEPLPTSQERRMPSMQEDLVNNYRQVAARFQQRLQGPRLNRLRIERARINLGNRLRRRIRHRPAFCVPPMSERESQVPQPVATQEEPVAEEEGAVGGAPCPPAVPIVIDLDEDEGSRASAPNPSQSPERVSDSLFERIHQVNSTRHAYMEVARARRMRESRYGRHGRHCLDRDELFARQLQDEYDQEIDIGHSADVPIHHAPPDLAAAGPMAPSHPYRRRTMFRNHYASMSNMPHDLLLPFMSVVSVPPPLHHYSASVLDHMGEAEDYEALWNLTERLGPAKARGLSKEVIDRIESFRYCAQSKDSSNGKCVVCMMDYSNREKLRRLPCNHDFHSKCVDRWLRNNRTCPVCREVLGS